MNALSRILVSALACPCVVVAESLSIVRSRFTKPGEVMAIESRMGQLGNSNLPAEIHPKKLKAPAEKTVKKPKEDNPTSWHKFPFTHKQTRLKFR